MISVCLATYNGEHFIEEQLNSILPQLKPHDELLISDDGSTDKTLEILSKFTEPNISLFRNSFKNPAKNFEFLLGKVSKSYVVLSDQDDVWLPGKLEKVRVNLKETYRKCLLMNAYIIDGKGNKTGETTFEKWSSRVGYWPNVMRNTFMGSSMAFTADLLPIALPFPSKIAMHDWWLGLLAEKVGQVELIEDPLMLYRIHGHNTSLQGSSMSQKLVWRANMIQAIRKRLKDRKPWI